MRERRCSLLVWILAKKKKKVAEKKKKRVLFFERKSLFTEISKKDAHTTFPNTNTFVGWVFTFFF